MSVYPTNEPACVEPPDDDAVELVLEAKPRDVGSLTVARVLPAMKRRLIGPFCFLDHMGPVDIPPGVGFDIKPHPHIGLSTVTYFLAGENVHRDSLGSVQVNRPGDLNLMRAGRGVVHSERADPAWRARGGRLHGIQIWLALPEANEDDAPSFAHHPAATLPAIARDRVTGRVLIGSAFGATSPVDHPGAPLLVDLALEPGACLDVAVEPAERGVYVIDGAIRIGRDAITGDQLAVLREGARARIEADAASRVLLVGGPPLPPRVMDWNFVASSRERIERAKAAWKAQQLAVFPKVPGDDVEYVPLPELARG
ncbi:MAG TPA: pirin family protein [Kofleriaceae bacterium]|nr:pirin family protein [Kofleriaceae bacterium]